MKKSTMSSLISYESAALIIEVESNERRKEGRDGWMDGWMMLLSLAGFLK